MTYEESSSLMSNAIFHNRVKVACLKFADTIMIESNSVPAHNTRMRWANDTYRMPDQAATVVQSPVVMDPGVQSAAIEEDGDSAITDVALSAAVEAVVNKML